MRLLIIISLLVSVVVTAGCSSFNMNLALGYRKVPPEVSAPMVNPATVAEKGEALGLTPDQIQWILDFLSGENMKFFFPEDNRTMVGLEFDISAK